MSFGDDQLDMFAGAPAGVGPDVEREPTAIGVWPMDCRNVEGVRPCPFATCRHHLLIDFVFSGPGEPSLATNRAGSLVQLRGRRPELAPDASRAEVDAFAEAAVAALWRLPDTCAREVARRHLHAEEAEADRLGRDPRPEVMTFDEIAAVLGEADPDELAEELASLRDALRGDAIAAGADPNVEEDAVAALGGQREPVESALARLRLALWFGCEPAEVDDRIDEVLCDHPVARVGLSMLRRHRDRAQRR